MPTYQCVINGTITIPEEVAPPSPPLGIWGGGNLPIMGHPIAPGGPPPGIWGGAPPQIGYPLPQPPLGFWGGVAPPYPAHPIAPGGPPLGFWGGVAPPQVGYPLPPVAGTPGHPIVLPPPGQPAHPIVIPPDEPGAPERKFEVKTVWTAQTGWVVVAIPAEGTQVPTPAS